MTRSTYPLGRPMEGGCDVDDPPTVMVQNDQVEQKPEADGRHDEQVDGGNAVGMVAQERQPSLRRRASSANHVVRDGRLRDIDPEIQQLPVYSRRAPQGIGDADLPDETPYICWYTRPSGFAPGLDFPDQAKPCPVPSHDRLGTNDQD